MASRRSPVRTRLAPPLKKTDPLFGLFYIVRAHPAAVPIIVCFLMFVTLCYTPLVVRTSYFKHNLASKIVKHREGVIVMRVLSTNELGECRLIEYFST